jgi:hypothetical protein
LLSGWWIARHDRSWDLTQSGRHSLSAESLGVLARLEAPLSIRIFAPAEGELARAIEQVIQPYRQASSLVRTETIDPQLFPELARAAEVRVQGQLVLEYQHRRELLDQLSESSLTNAIARLQLQEPPWIAVLEGHGEPALDGAAAADLRGFAQLLLQRGMRLLPLDLSMQAQVPDNIDLLILSRPAIALFPGESLALIEYLERGGNLLWLLDPETNQDLLGLEPLLNQLSIERLPGQIVDAAAGDLGLEAPTIAVVADWPPHPLTRDFDQPALLPGALALRLEQPSAWLMAAALQTGALSWNETGPVRGKISPDPAAGEQPGPLSVALLLIRPVTHAPHYDPARDPIEAQPDAAPRRQRVAVIGDGDFLSNAHLDQGANKALALQLVRWLAHRDDLIAVPPPATDTQTLSLSPLRLLLISIGALAALPGLFSLIALATLWSRRRN